MSLFGAVRLYVESADRTVRDVALSDGDYVLPLRDGAWALWAKLGDRTREVQSLPPMWRVEPGPVHIARSRSAAA
jgi:hypothetical protein